MLSAVPPATPTGKGGAAETHASPGTTTPLNGHAKDAGSSSERSGAALMAALASLPLLTPEHVDELASAAVARKCFLQQQQNLAAFAAGFLQEVDADFRTNQRELLAAFTAMISGMELKLTEQAWESSSSRTGTVTIALPGLPDGVTVTRSTDTFFVNEGNTLLERDEVRVKLGGLDVYSGYWLAVDAPGRSIEDPLQEEGVDTLRRVMEAAGLLRSDAVYEDALEYPFLSALLSPFGPEAALPFEAHLRAMHREYSHRHGGGWFRMTSPRKQRSTLEQVAEEGDDAAAATAGGEPGPSRRQRMTDAEEAELELDRLDL